MNSKDNDESGDQSEEEAELGEMHFGADTSQVVVGDGGKFNVDSIIGPHGHAETMVDRGDSGVKVDLSPWVDSDGVGESVGGHLVEKEFAGPVVIFEDLEWEGTDKGNVASRAYVGEIIDRMDEQTLLVDFETQPSSEEHSVTFSPASVTQDNGNGTLSITYVDRDPEEVRDELRDCAGDTDLVADGGLDVRDFRDVRYSDALVREYQTPPGGNLYAYQSEDGNHHIVVSRGKEPGDRWEKRVPAERDRVVPGEQLWTIPDNWELRVSDSRDDRSMGLYYNEETDMWAKMSIPTNNWLTDAWYGVKAVGDLVVSPAGDIGSVYDVREYANEYEQGHESEEVAEDADAFRAVANGWSEVEKELENTVEWVLNEGVEQLRSGDQPLSTSDWEIEFHQSRIFRAGDAVERAADLSEYEISTSEIVNQLHRADLLPGYYRFELGLDDSKVGMEYYVRGLVEAGASPAEAVDYYMVEMSDLTKTEWASERGIYESEVSDNVDRVNRVVGS